ncbi:MAG: hypothetical protein U0270_41690 [Labilithrix sp.]
MRARLLSCFLSIALVMGCVASNADVTTDTASLSTSVFTAATAKTFTFRVHGSGVMQVGDECAPGDETFTLQPNAIGIPIATLSRCLGAPLRLERRWDVYLAPEQIDEIIQGVRRITYANEGACRDDAPLEELVIDKPRDATGAELPSQRFINERYACDASTVRPAVHGLEEVIQRVRRAFFTPSPHPLGVARPNGEAGKAVWDARSDSIWIRVGGAGRIPQGSECAPGSEWYDYSPAFTHILWMDCEPDVHGHLRSRGKARRLEDDEIASLAETPSREGRGAGLVQPESTVLPHQRPREHAGRWRRIRR